MEKHSRVITFAGNPLTLVGTLTKVGSKAQDFTALNNQLQPVKLSDFAGKIKVISVVPSVDTGICEAQTRWFNKEAAELENVAILTISCDLPFALGRFCGAHGIDKVVTVSDHIATEFGIKYGFLIEELRLLSRGVVVIDKNDNVTYVEYVNEVTNHANYDQALIEIKKLV
ncbi:MAG: thiol peroxidase [Bacteroidota bacterium]